MHNDPFMRLDESKKIIAAIGTHTTNSTKSSVRSGAPEFLFWSSGLGGATALWKAVKLLAVHTSYYSLRSLPHPVSSASFGVGRFRTSKSLDDNYQYDFHGKQ
jgi:hypothetical protein